MPENKLPENLRGRWIWCHSVSEKGTANYVFFRKEIHLASMANQAILWISAGSLYQIFINGRLIGFGPPVAEANRYLAEAYDISYCLENGANCIGILARADAMPQISREIQTPCLWCQLDIENTPALWTDSQWKCLPSEAHLSRTPLKSGLTGTTEQIDFLNYPQGWNEPGFNDSSWFNAMPTVISSISHGRLVPFGMSPLDVEEVDDVKTVSKGKFFQRSFSTNVSFASLPPPTQMRTVYAAEAYIYSEEELKLRFSVITDNSLKIFLNDKIEFEYKPIVFDINTNIPLYLQSSLDIGGRGELNIKKGWNKIIVALNCKNSSCSFNLSFPELEPEDIKFFTEPEENSREAWNIVGPLKMSWDDIDNCLLLQKPGKKNTIFKPSLGNTIDPAAFLRSCVFQNFEDINSDSVQELELAQGEFAIFELPKLLFGFPQIEFNSSSSEAIADIILGDRLIDGIVSSFDSSGRKICSVHLPAEKAFSWNAFSPEGVRFIMICARKAEKPFKITSLSFNRLYRGLEENSFISSDETINAIWNSGINTLRNCVSNCYMDSPNGYQTQFLAEAMIESLATFYSFGHGQLTENAIKEFISAQYENGRMPSVCPSSFYTSLADYCLLFPFWVAKFADIGLSIEVLQEAGTTIDSIFAYFAKISREDGLLEDIKMRYNLDFLIDYDENIGKEGISVALNSLYSRALLSAADIYNRIGQGEKALEYRKKASEIASALRKIAWNKEKSLFCDYVVRDEQSAQCSMQTNVLAILGGVAESSTFDSIFESFFVNESPLIKDETVITPYFSFFILETFFALGRKNWCAEFIKTYWGKIIEKDKDCLWSFFPNANGAEPDTDLCHGFSASPNYFIMTELAGIRPGEQGFKRIFFNPAFSILNSAKISLFTNEGRINISWETAETGEINIRVDAKFQVELAIIIPRETLDICTIEKGELVSVLEPQ
ncbi:MAG: alpha-L-rhamnosidase N-terminal domain-containing protein [Candidatus Nanoarchaeia archaeon]